MGMTRVQFDDVTEDAPIDDTGTIVEKQITGEVVVSLNIVGTASADYSLDVGPDGETWFEDEETYSGTDVRDAFVLGHRWLRVRVDSAAGAGETATVTIQGAR